MITILKNNIITDKLVFEAKDGDTPVGSVVCTTDGETLFVEKLETQYIGFTNIYKTVRKLYRQEEKKENHVKKD